MGGSNWRQTASDRMLQHQCPGRPGSRLAVLLAAAAALLVLLPAQAYAAPDSPQPAAADYLNAKGLPLLMPVNRSTDTHSYYYELPREKPAGLLVMLHRCGRNAEDFWPPSEVCPQCIGMPEGVSMSKQALARGYALLAINSFNRSVGPQTRCWSWATDAEAVRGIVTTFRQEFGLEALPLFFTGCSSGGSLALRLPGFMEGINGIIPVAIGVSGSVFPAVEIRGAYPPVAAVHFPRDPVTEGRVQEMFDIMAKYGVPAAEVRVGPYPVTPDFFSRRDPMISFGLSEQLHGALENLTMLEEDGNLLAEWLEDPAVALPWEQLLDGELPQLIQPVAAEQLELKNHSTLAKAQQALKAAGEELLTVQEVSADDMAAFEEQVNAEDANPNFSDGNGTASSSGGEDPYLSSALLKQHVREEVGVALAVHVNLGDHLTAALIWLESCGKADFEQLLANFTVTEPAKLSPVRTASYDEVAGTWQACSGSSKRRRSSRRRLLV